LSEALEAERLYGLAAYQDFYWGNSPQPPGGPFQEALYPYVSWIFDINILLKQANKFYEVLIDADSIVDDTELVKQVEMLKSKPMFSALTSSCCGHTTDWNPIPYFFVRGRTNRLGDTLLIEPLLQGMLLSREFGKRMECAENMQRLTLALLLYEKEHGKLPEGDWREAVKPYLGENADEYFRCPSRRLEVGYTSYAMIRDVPNAVASPMQILIVEVVQPQKLGEGDGRIPYEKAKFWKDPVNPYAPRPDNFDGLGSHHPGGICVGLRSGGMLFLSESRNPDEVQELLSGTSTELP
jgi:hypothetical protein